jgi:hypothetical protein
MAVSIFKYTVIYFLFISRTLCQSVDSLVLYEGTGFITGKIYVCMWEGQIPHSKVTWNPVNIFSKDDINIKRFSKDSINIQDGDLIVFDTYLEGVTLIRHSNFPWMIEIVRDHALLDNAGYRWTDKKIINDKIYRKLHLRMFDVENDLILRFKTTSQYFIKFSEGMRFIPVKMKNDTVNFGILINKDSELARLTSSVKETERK